MMAIGVLSGLDDRETLMAENPNMILQNINELIKLFP
jgi:phosphoglycolate phosphatase-like HAD superfamily hydrolase